MGDSTGGEAWGYCIAMSPCGAIWVSGAFVNSQDSSGHIYCMLNIDGLILTFADGSSDPVFIAGFNIVGGYIGSAALQSGADDQNGIACDAKGNVYMCADYECIPFITGNDTLATIPLIVQEWQYIAKYTFVSNQDTFSFLQDTAVCSYAGMVLHAPQGSTGYIWENGSTDTVRHINAAGTYWVVGKGVCTTIDSFKVTDSAFCGCEVLLPNAFTPNHDGWNDYFRPIFVSACTIINYSFAIYNRWGQRVFYSEDPTAKWDGTFEGVRAELGVYMYYLQYAVGIADRSRTLKGDVTLIR